jgi:hypothetical protein
MPGRLRGLLVHGGLLSLLAGLIILAPAAPADTADLWLATSTVSLTGNLDDPDPARRAAAWRSAKVVSLDGTTLLPYTEANLKASQFRQIIGKVDRRTGKPVQSALAINKNSCDPGAAGQWEFCIGVEYYYSTGGSRLVALSVKLEDYRSPGVCDASLQSNGRYFNVWRNISILHDRADPDEIRKSCVGTPATTERFYYKSTSVYEFPRQTRFHPTASQYDDAANGHPVVWLT